MSYDLIMWSAIQPVQTPALLWSALYYQRIRDYYSARDLPRSSGIVEDAARRPMLPIDQANASVVTLAVKSVVAAFRREFGDDLEVSVEDDDRTCVAGRGWDFRVNDGDRYLHVTCAWPLANDAAALSRLRRAALRAQCSTFDPQTGEYFEPVQEF